MTIIEFLQARITEDEREVKVSLNQYQRGENVTTRRWLRMIDECKAKRTIISLHSPIDPCDAHDEQMHTVSCDTLRALAYVYADHPDYQEAWQGTF